MCLAQGPQRSDAGEAQTRGPSVIFICKKGIYICEKAILFVKKEVIFSCEKTYFICEKRYFRL